jgi:transcription initiation factor TFIIB
MLNLLNLTMNLSKSSNCDRKIDNYNDYNINHYDDNYNINNTMSNNFDLDNINIDDLENLDNLDNLDCNKFFNDIYNNIIPESNNKQKSKCSRCDSDDFIEDYTNGIIICTCGQVINNLYDTVNDVRQYEDDTKQENKRYNKVTNELLPQSSLGAKLPYNIKGNLQKIQNWGAMPYRERSLYNDFKIINSACETLNLNKNIQQSANIYYASAKSCKHPDGENEGKHIITRGKNNKGIQGGCIWISCKKHNIPILSKDIAEQFGLTIKELNKGIKSLKRLLEIKNMSVQLNIIGSEEYVRKYCTSENVKTEYMDQAIQIARNIDKLNVITEHTQFSIAATSVLIMAELNSINNVTKKSLKQMFGISNVTISKAYKKLEKLKHILINDKKVDKLVEKIKKLNNMQQLTSDIKDRMDKFGIDINKNEKIYNRQINTDSNQSDDSNHNNLKIIVKNSTKNKSDELPKKIIKIKN